MNQQSTEARRRRLARLRTEQQREVLDVAVEIAGTVGGDFFRSITEHLSRALNLDCTYIAELSGPLQDKAKAIAAYRDGQPIQYFQQELPGTASMQVLTDGAVALSADAAMIFPLDPLLESIAAEGYVGLRLSDSKGQVMGLVAAVSQARIENLPLVKSVLHTFAQRAAGELERKRALDALRESDERYRAFVSSSLDGMWRIEFEHPVSLELPEEEQIRIIFRDGYIGECNEALARLLGDKTAEELVGTPFSELFDRGDERVNQELRSFIQSGYRAATVQTMPLDADGRREYRLRSQCGIVQDNKLLRIWGTTRDVTELKRAQMAVEASQRRFREVLAQVRLPALILDPVGDVVFCNNFLTQLTGVKAGANWLHSDCCVHERAVWSAMLADHDSQAELQIDSVLRLPDGASRPVSWDIVILRDEDGGQAGLAAIGTQL